MAVLIRRNDAVRLAVLVSLVAYAVPTTAGSLDGFGGFGAPFSGYAGPYDAASPQWLQAVNNSNSTGLFHIPGYDVSQPYPGKPIDGWTLSVAAIDLSGSSYTFNPDDDEERVVGYSLAVQAPDSLIKAAPDGTKIVNVDPSWGMCIWYFEAPPRYSNRSWYNNPTGRPLATDGSCEGFVPDKCISALENAGSTNYKILTPSDAKWYNSRVGCYELDLPDECGNLVGNTTLPLPSYGGVPIAYLNGSVTNQDGWDNLTDKPALEIHEMWDSLVLNYWPTLVVYVPIKDMNASDSSSSNSSAEDTPPGLSQLLCISPDGVGTGRFFSYNGTSPNASGGGAGANGTGDAGNGNGTKNSARRATGQLSVLPVTFTAVALSAILWLCLG